jgi:hypothetical protein
MAPHDDAAASEAAERPRLRHPTRKRRSRRSLIRCRPASGTFSARRRSGSPSPPTNPANSICSEATVHKRFRAAHCVPNASVSANNRYVAPSSTMKPSHTPMPVNNRNSRIENRTVAASLLDQFLHFGEEQRQRHQHRARDDQAEIAHRQDLCQHRADHATNTHRQADLQRQRPDQRPAWWKLAMPAIAAISTGTRLVAFAVTG